MPLVAPFEEDEHPRDPGGEDGGRFIPKGTTAAGGQPDDAAQAPEVDAEEDDRPATAKHLETFTEVTPYVASEGCMGWLTADGTAIDIEGEAHHRAAERLGFTMDDMFAEGNARLYAQPGEDGFLGIEITQRPTDAQIKVLVDAAQHGNFERFAIDGGGENGHRKGVIRPRDVREVINAVFGEPAKPTGIKGLPKGIEVRDDSLQRAIGRGAFDITAKPRGYAPGFKLTVTAKLPAGIATIEQRGRPVYYNPELAELVTVDEGTEYERQIPQLKAGFKTEIEPLPAGNTAFGNPDRDDIAADPNFAFHATSIERAQEIAEGGKLDTHRPSYGTDQDAWPDGATEKRSYWTHDPKIARSFVYLAEHLIDIHQTKQGEVWDDDMTAWAKVKTEPQIDKKTGKVKVDKKTGKPKTNLDPELFEATRGKRLGELTDPTEKALWIRAYDETHNDRHYPKIKPTGEAGDLARNKPTKKNPKGELSTAAWQTLPNIANAITSLEANGNREVISAAMGEAHKVRSFYNNILDPNSPNGDATMDTHAFGAALLRPLGGQSGAVSHGFGLTPDKDKQPPGWKGTSNSAVTGNVGLYGLYVDAYREVAVELGIQPRQLQSIVWEHKRELFDRSLTDKQAAAIEQAWRDYHDGKQSLNVTQKRVLETVRPIKAAPAELKKAA